LGRLSAVETEEKRAGGELKFHDGVKMEFKPTRIGACPCQSLVLAIIPFGDMSIILGSGGSKSKAFFIHGLTCAVILVVGLLLIHAS
jgi:hypothetical protein